MHDLVTVRFKLFTSEVLPRNGKTNVKTTFVLHLYVAFCVSAQRHVVTFNLEILNLVKGYKGNLYHTLVVRECYKDDVESQWKT